MNCARILTRCGRLVLAINGVATDVEEVPDLVQRAVLAADIGLRAAVQLGQGCLDIAQAVGLGAVGGDARIGEGLYSTKSNQLLLQRVRMEVLMYRVSVQRLEQVHDLLEEISDLLLR